MNTNCGEITSKCKVSRREVHIAANCFYNSPAYVIIIELITKHIENSNVRLWGYSFTHTNNITHTAIFCY